MIWQKQCYLMCPGDEKHGLIACMTIYMCVSMDGHTPWQLPVLQHLSTISAHRHWFATGSKANTCYFIFNDQQAYLEPHKWLCRRVTASVTGNQANVQSSHKIDRPPVPFVHTLSSERRNLKATAWMLLHTCKEKGFKLLTPALILHVLHIETL